MERPGRLPEIVAHLLHGETAPQRLTLHHTTRLPTNDGGWILLGERPGQELALGLVGKSWRPMIQYADVEAEHFGEFAEPGWAKTVYALSATATTTTTPFFAPNANRSN